MSDWVRITYEIGGNSRTEWAPEGSAGKGEGMAWWVNVETGQRKEIPVDSVPFVITFDVELPPAVEHKMNTEGVAADA